MSIVSSQSLGFRLLDYARQNPDHSCSFLFVTEHEGMHTYVRNPKLEKIEGLFRGFITSLKKLPGHTDSNREVIVWVSADNQSGKAFQVQCCLYDIILGSKGIHDPIGS